MNLWAKFSKLLGGGPVQIVEVTAVYSAFGDVQFDGIVLPGTTVIRVRAPAVAEGRAAVDRTGRRGHRGRAWRAGADR